MKKILCFLPGLLSLLALAGCCANDVCACNDELADALYFSFQIGGSKGFQASEVDTLFLVRTTYPDATTKQAAVSDSVLRILPLTANGTGLVRDTIVLNNAAPFSSAGGNIKLSAYKYHLSAYQKDRTGVHRRTFVITNIKLTGRYNATGCCTCYENTGKQFDISSYANAPTTSTQVVTSAISQPIITQLTKTP